MNQNFDQENETPLFEGQTIDQTEITNEVEIQTVEELTPTEELQVEMPMQQAEPLEFFEETQQYQTPLFTQQFPTQEAPVVQNNEFVEETQQYQTPLFTQQFPTQEAPIVQDNEFIEETQQYQTPLFTQQFPTQEAPIVQNNEFVEETQQYQTPFVQPQTNTFFQGTMQEKPKSKKKLIVVVVSAVIVLVLLVLGGLYGYSVYTKSQALETVKNEKNSIKKKSDELQEKVTKYETFSKMKEFETCVYDTSDYGTGSGKAFTFSVLNYELVEKTESNFKEQLNRCKGKASDLKFDGAKEVIDSEIQKIEETYRANTQFVAEAKTITNQWNEFKGAWKTGTVEESEFNRIRALAATAMGVEPSTLGTHLSYYDISSATHRRMKEIENKQKTRTGADIKDFIAKNTKEESYTDISVLYQRKRAELEKMNQELAKKEKEVKEKESKVWNPFQ